MRGVRGGGSGEVVVEAVMTWTHLPARHPIVSRTGEQLTRTSAKHIAQAISATVATSSKERDDVRVTITVAGEVYEREVW